jgi:hypothetical protein
MDGARSWFSDTQVSSNRVASGQGGGVVNLGGEVSLDRCEIAANAIEPGGEGSFLTGGGVAGVGGSIHLTDCTIAGNRATALGGGLYLVHGSADLRRSTISSNTAGISAAGIYNQETELRMANCTLSGNVARDFGGALMNLLGPAEILHCTVTANSASLGGGVVNQVTSGTETVVWRSIVSGNDGGDVELLYGAVNSFVSKDYNLIGTGNATSAFGSANDTVGVTEPFLLSLGAYGGPTRTHVPHPGSPAIEENLVGNVVLTDQRGVARPAGNVMAQSDFDIGAVDVDPTVDLAFVWNADIDGDGAGFGVEFALGSDPLVPDTRPTDPAGVAGGTLQAGMEGGVPAIAFGFNTNALPVTEWVLTLSPTMNPPDFSTEVFRYHGLSETYSSSLDYDVVIGPDAITLRETNTLNEAYYRFEAEYIPLPP